ncbi:helix-turn-helix domain-containing protein [Saccharolobus islandicus]|uniref:helix-turn-helix domain-containing protein n=1 Tax=Saccharolobus islandicus TaxID=43080 RepID=UPI001FCBAF1D|nr:helix-turn-helix domain-containing protein [Sulfolobus islandicus]
MATTIIRRNDLFRPKSNKLQSDREKAKSSTQNKGEPGKTGKPGKNTPEMPEMPESPRILVDDHNKSQPNEKFITEETVESKDGRKVKIDVYRIGEEEKIEGDKVVRRAKLKFVISYRSVVKECVEDCRDTISEVAKATDYKVSKNVISEKVAELREEYGEEEEISIVDYVRQKYPDRLAEVEKDPFGWILQRTKEIVGYDRLKLLTFLSVISSQLKRIMGMSRINIMLVGTSGAGKSSTIKSVVRYVDGTDMYIAGTRLTQNALGYLNVDSFDGKVLFIEQIDRQNINYIREMMTEEKVCTLVTEKVVDENGNERHESHLRCTPGQSAVITTSVVDDINVDKEQIFNRFLKVYVNPKSIDTGVVIDAILKRSNTDVNEVDRLIFMAYLKSRPSFADITPVLDQAKKFVLSLQEYTREPLTRVTEILRNLVITTAIARGKTKADVDDFNFVMANFQLDVLYNGLGLTERDVEIIEALPDEGGLKSQEIADALKVSKQYAINVLKNLERKGVVEGEKEDGKTFTWYLTSLGRRIKALVSNLDVVEVRNDKGELIGAVDSKFRNDANAGNDRENAMSGNDRDAMQRGDGETNRVIEAYKYLKEHGWTLTTDIAGWFGDDVIEKLKRKDLVTFNVIDGVEYVNAK